MSGAVKPLVIRPLLGDGSFGADGSPSSPIGRLNCIPWGIVQVPPHETWKIDAIHVNNWGDRDAVYSLTIESETYTRASVVAATPGLRWQQTFATTGASTIRWGKLIEAGGDHRILGPFWVRGREWLAGAAIPGFTPGVINCSVNGWVFS